MPVIIDEPTLAAAVAQIRAGASALRTQDEPAQRYRGLDQLGLWRTLKAYAAEKKHVDVDVLVGSQARKGFERLEQLHDDQGLRFVANIERKPDAAALKRVDGKTRRVIEANVVRESHELDQDDPEGDRDVRKARRAEARRSAGATSARTRRAQQTRRILERADDEDYQAGLVRMFQADPSAK